MLAPRVCPSAVVLPSILTSILTIISYINSYLSVRRCFSSLSCRGALCTCLSMSLVGAVLHLVACALGLGLPGAIRTLGILTRESYLLRMCVAAAVLSCMCVGVSFLRSPWGSQSCLARACGAQLVCCLRVLAGHCRHKSQRYSSGSAMPRWDALQLASGAG